MVKLATMLPDSSSALRGRGRHNDKGDKIHAHLDSLLLMVSMMRHGFGGCLKEFHPACRM